MLVKFLKYGIGTQKPSKLNLIIQTHSLNIPKIQPRQYPYLKNKYGGFPALQSQYFPLKYCFPYGYNILKYPELKQVMRKLL